MPRLTAQPADLQLTVDELGARTGVPVRTIRQYQTEGLLPAPERQGRVGVYRTSHVTRLELIARLQARGYSLAAIRDLLRSWSDGADLGEVLGVGPDELVHLDEPGAPATLQQLATLLPALVPGRLDELLATGVVEAHGAIGYGVPSPSLLQLAIDALAAGYGADAVLRLLSAVRAATDAVAEAAIGLLTERPEGGGDIDALVRLATRGRGLLAHGTGRLTVHTIGRRLGVARQSDLGSALRQALEVGE